MAISAEVASAVAVISAIIALVEKIDPAAAQNKVVVDLNKVLSFIQAVPL